MNTYRCEKGRFAEVERRIKAISKKLTHQGLECHFNIIAEHPQEIDYMVESPDTHEFIKHGTIVVDVVEYEFEMPELKLGEWEPIAVINHNSTIDGNCNVVIAINGHTTDELPKTYWTAPATCEHCNSNRRRKTTVILQNVDGELKQVGSTCVHDFTGINAIDIIHAYTEVTDIYESALAYYSTDAHTESKYAGTIDYLTACVADVREFGYRSNEITKYKAWDRVKAHEQFKDVDVEKAQTIFEFFKDMDPDNFGTNWSFYNNIKHALANEFTKATGFIAYAPVAYESALKYLEEQAAAAEGASQWVGEVNDRVTLTLEHIRTHGFDGYYGWSAIHKFKDADGNIYIWSTSKLLCETLGEDWLSQDKRMCEVTGTIKKHSTYNGEKQTELTRCKLKAI